MFLPSPLVGEGGSRRLPDEGSLSAESCLSVEPTPHRSEFVVGVGVALSHKGRGRSNGYPLPCGRGRSNGRCERKRSSGEDDKMPIKYDELMPLKNLGQKYAYSDREVMLYAYRIGMGADPMDEQEVAFVDVAADTQRAVRVV